MFTFNLDNAQSTRRLLSLTLAASLSISSSLVAPAAFAAKSASPPSIQSTTGKTNSFVEVAVNKSRVIQLNSPVSRVSVSNPDMLGIVVISPTELQIIGKTVGNCSILVWSENSGKNYLNIDVAINRDVTTLAQKIKAIDPGIQVLPMAAQDTVILTGYTASKDKAQLVYDLAKVFFETGDPLTSSNSSGSSIGVNSSSTKIINMIRVAGQPNTKSDMVQEKLHEINPNITLMVVPGPGGEGEKAMLTGRVRTGSDVSKAINLTSVFYGQPGIKIVTGPAGSVPGASVEGSAGSFGTGGTSGSLIGNLDKNILQGSIISDASGNVISMLQIEERPQIRCHIQMLEVSKSVDFSSGVNLLAQNSRLATTSTNNGSETFETLFNTGTLAINEGGGQFVYRFGRDLLAYVEGLVTDGKARVLAEPNIVTISGEPATFLAGGEFPIPSVSGTGQVSILFKEFGVRLNVLPTLTERNTIHMQVSPEVSSLDDTAGVTFAGATIPGLRTRRSQAVVEMADGENFVLSGLYNESMSKTLRKTPILGQIPILGELFRSRDFNNQKTELVIIIRPEVIGRVPQATDNTGSPNTLVLPPLSQNGLPQPLAQQPMRIDETVQAFTALAKDEAKQTPLNVSPQQDAPFTIPSAGSESKVISSPTTPTKSQAKPAIKAEAAAASPTRSILEEAQKQPYGLGPNPEWTMPQKASERIDIDAASDTPSPNAVGNTSQKAVGDEQPVISLLDLSASDLEKRPPVVAPIAEAPIAKDSVIITAMPAVKMPLQAPLKTAKTTSHAKVIIPSANSYLATTPAVTPKAPQLKPSAGIAAKPKALEAPQKTVSLLDQSTEPYGVRAQKTVSLLDTPLGDMPKTPATPVTKQTASLDKAIQSAVADNQKVAPKAPVEAAKPKSNPAILPKETAPAEPEQATVSLVDGSYGNSEQGTQSLLPADVMAPSLKPTKRPRLLDETVESVLESLEAQRQDDFESTIKAALNKPRNNR